MGKSLFGVNTLSSATLTMTTEDASYPATNGNDLDPGDPLKSTATSTVVTMTYSGSITAAAFAIINHNLAGATVTLANNAAPAYSQTITIPARTADGQCVNAWRDTRADANRSAAVWTLTITGASANVAIGELLLVESLQELNWRWGGGSGPAFSSEWPNRILRTFYKSRLVYDTGIRVRTGSGQATRETDKAALLSLAQSVKGARTPFLFVHDIAVNDPWMAVLPDASTLTWTRLYQANTDTPITIEEVSSGLPL